jgi:hypothetical protein
VLVIGYLREVRRGRIHVRKVEDGQLHYPSFILSIMAEQQVNLQDLDLNQLQDVKKQLDSVCHEIYTFGKQH